MPAIWRRWGEAVATEPPLSPFPPDLVEGRALSSPPPPLPPDLAEERTPSLPPPSRHRLPYTERERVRETEREKYVVEGCAVGEGIRVGACGAIYVSVWLSLIIYAVFFFIQ